MFENFNLWPKSASTFSGDIDALFLFLCAVTIFFSAGIFAAVLFCSVRYRRKRNPVSTQIEGSTTLEIIWSVIPLGLTMIMFLWGAQVFLDVARPRPGGLDIYVTGKQWMWKLQHPDGQREINELHVPVNTPVNLTMISEDVIHSFFVPEFRMKRDVVPGRYSRAWFEATEVGEYKLLCAEYCGTEHSQMIGTVHVLEHEEYERWLAGNLSGETPLQLGKKLFDQLRCDSCHNDTPGARAPQLAGRFGGTSVLDDGSSVVFDEDYFRESLYRPLAKQVAGWDAVMPTYEGQLSEEQVLQVLAYVQSLEGQASPVPEDTPPPAPEDESPEADVPGDDAQGDQP